MISRELFTNVMTDLYEFNHVERWSKNVEKCHERKIVAALEYNENFFPLRKEFKQGLISYATYTQKRLTLVNELKARNTMIDFNEQELTTHLKSMRDEFELLEENIAEHIETLMKCVDSLLKKAEIISDNKELLINFYHQSALLYYYVLRRKYPEFNYQHAYFFGSDHDGKFNRDKIIIELDKQIKIFDKINYCIQSALQLLKTRRSFKGLAQERELNYIFDEASILHEKYKDLYCNFSNRETEISRAPTESQIKEQKEQESAHIKTVSEAFKIKASDAAIPAELKQVTSAADLLEAKEAIIEQVAENFVLSGTECLKVVGFYSRKRKHVAIEEEKRNLMDSLATIPGFNLARIASAPKDKIEIKETRQSDNGMDTSTMELKNHDQKLALETDDDSPKTKRLRGVTL